MVNSMVLLDENGPLPVSAKFTAPADGSVMFVLSGTAWTGKAPAMLGINLFLDGAEIGKPALLFANQNSDHMALRTTFILYENLTPGDHLLQVEASYANTVTDLNDYFQVTILY
jgi:hypothetical protein